MQQFIWQRLRDVLNLSEEQLPFVQKFLPGITLSMPIEGKIKCIDSKLFIRRDQVLDHHT